MNFLSLLILRLIVAYIILENTISYISSIPPNPLFQNVSRLCPPLQGVPMVASSPVRHESPMQMNPIEVHSYQQSSWQSFNSYQIKNEMEHPPLQQLVSFIIE
jgi:hypothetical protein